MIGAVRALIVAAALLVSAAAHASSIGEVWQHARWGDGDAALARAFGSRATVLDPPIEYGDSTVRVVLRDVRLGGHEFAVYFQTDAAGLRRIHFERPRHGAVLGVFRDVVAAIEAEYGDGAYACDVPPRSTLARQIETTRIWEVGGGVIRAVFRAATLAAGEGCLAENRSGTSPCGLTGQIFVQVSRDDSGC
jgi:hypothetical protein